LAETVAALPVFDRRNYPISTRRKKRFNSKAGLRLVILLVADEQEAPDLEETSSCFARVLVCFCEKFYLPKS